MPETTANILVLNDRTRDFLKRMHFDDIPEEANYIAFYEDGQAQFFKELSITGGFQIPKPCILSMYEDIPIEMTD